MASPPHFLTALVDAEAGSLQIIAPGLAEPIATRVFGAFDSASRRKGLLGRSAIPEGEALVIAPCNAVHTFGMRFAIDVIYAHRDGRVVKLCHAVHPNRVSAALGAFAVVELPAGTLARTGLNVGDRLVLAAASDADPANP